MVTHRPDFNRTAPLAHGDALEGRIELARRVAGPERQFPFETQVRQGQGGQGFAT
ncbi:MAG: hypothetical protein M5U12_11200 [Verrucomicrobia bacterium]|nr:hypothetical protein [Verrucomicrobiota bacterium]